MLNFILKIGRLKTTVFITLVSITMSVLITFVLMNLLENGLSLSGAIASILAPTLITPMLTWCIFGLLFRIDQLEKTQRNLATFDMLTGLMTRRAFIENGQTLLRLIVRDRRKMSLAFIDLDNFKGINDQYGHEGGDEALKSTSTILKSHLRNSDLVGRLGGEEFVIAFPNTDLESSVQLLEEIRLSVGNSPIDYLGEIFKCTISIGVSVFNENNKVGLEELIRQSDIALYDAKNSGKNCVVTYKTHKAN